MEVASISRGINCYIIIVCVTKLHQSVSLRLPLSEPYFKKLINNNLWNLALASAWKSEFQ
jgi:hypothetical protein